MQIVRRLVLASVLLLCCRAASPAQDHLTLPFGANTLLSGLGGLRVEVSAIGPEAQQDGLNADVLRADAEFQLQRAHIPVQSLAEHRAEPGHPVLFLDVETMKRKDSGKKRDTSLYVYTLRVQLRETMRMNRRPDLSVYGATTWEAGEMGAASPDNLKNIRDAAVAYVSKFVEAYKTANAGNTR